MLLAWGVAAACLVAAATGLGFALAGDQPVPWRFLLIPALWAVPAALIAAARPRAVLGWVNLAVAVILALVGLLRAWLPSGVAEHPHAATLAVWFVDRGGAVLVPAITLGLLLLPDSRLPGRRWRIPVIGAVAVQVLLVALWSLSDTAVGAADSEWAASVATRANPFGFLPAEAAELADRLVWLLQLPLVLCVLALAVRLLRSTGAERQGLAALLLGVGVLVGVMLAGHSVLGPWSDLVDVLAALFLSVLLVAAVLRRHLDGVVLVVHHAFVLTVLAAAVVGLYVVVVASVAAAGPELSRFEAGVVAALAALAVNPLRHRLMRWVDRLMHGDRRDPFAAVSRLAESAHRAPSVVDVLERVRESVSVSLRTPDVRVQAFGVARPDSPPPSLLRPARQVEVPMLAGERQVGSITVWPQLGRRLGADECRLLEDLGRHAGIAVDAVHLAEQLARHHRAVVTVREEERRRLGRELHDELGPTVAGLSMQLGALRPLVHAEPAVVVARLARLEAAAVEAVGAVRRAAHALRPPALDQVGLGRALLQVAESLDLVVSEYLVEHGPLPAAVELAAYRIASEALTNVSRHAGSRNVRLGLREISGELVVTIQDDGHGALSVPPGGPAGGLGLSTMRERAEELGGTFSMQTSGDTGSLVTATLPLAPVDRATAPGEYA